MKTGILTTKNIASEDIKDTKSIMGMSMKGMEIAQYFLRDKIYTDKVLAVIREYVSNALDEHKKYAIDKSVEVNIKRINGQWIWAVRDYALGLNEHDIRNVFGMYFESTKSETNDAIGGFGIGGKAGFSYTDTFYVASYHNGTKTSYVCTLGASAKGVPVGEIYKISEEDTTEQGIEISLEIKPGDEYKFVDKTHNLVKFLPPKTLIKFKDDYNYTAYDYTAYDGPLQPLNTKVIGDYTFSRYDSGPSNKYSVRMGGIVYPYSSNASKRRAFSGPVVVDVPIGKLSIPISRESIENTVLNDKIFTEIEEHLDTINNEELSSLTPPKFGSLATGNIPRGNDHAGDWFVYNFRDMFPTTNTFYYRVHRIWDDPTKGTSTVSKGNANHIIYIYPNIENVKNWHKRLINTLKDLKGNKYSGYAWMYKSDYENMMNSLDSSIDISDCAFMDIKTMKLPKLETVGNKDNTEYIVYDFYGRKNSYTAENLNQIVTNKYFGGNEPDDDWYTQCKNIDELHYRTIGDSKNYGTRNHFKTAYSKTMIENLVSLGWLTPNMQEYKDMREKFNEVERQKRFESNIDTHLHNIFYGAKYNDNLKSAILKKNDKLETLNKIKNDILKENSTRARILRSISSYDRKINRADLRAILNIKG